MCRQISHDFTSISAVFKGILGVPVQVVIFSDSGAGVHSTGYLFLCQLQHLRQEVSPKQHKAPLASGVTAMPRSILVNYKGLRCRNAVIYTV